MFPQPVRSFRPEALGPLYRDTRIGTSLAWRFGAQYRALYATEDFVEGRQAEAEGRPPKYKGK